MSRKERNPKAFADEPKKVRTKPNEMRKNAPVQQLPERQAQAEPTAQPATYTARQSAERFHKPKGAYPYVITGNFLRVFAAPDGRVKARSRRGWCEPSPATVAHVEADKAAKAAAEARATKREAEREAAAERHFKWLVDGALALPEVSRLTYLSDNTNPAMVTKVLDHIANMI